MLIDFAVAAAINVSRRPRRSRAPPTLPARTEAARRLPAGDAVLGADVGSASLPLMIALPDLSFTDAYFEAMSGLTTTGSTVLDGLDSAAAVDQPLAARAALVRRHRHHRAGGRGAAAARRRRHAAVPRRDAGPVKDEKLTPRITETAKALWFTYIGLTAIGAVALKLAGMSWFDAICHAFSAISLGGFSTHDSPASAISTRWRSSSSWWRLMTAGVDELRAPLRGVRA
jgi:Trk-type K+ transport system membrane component